jgi:4-amino-4-deoxy-L-arabinose transferase-like glycosyltransferase
MSCIESQRLSRTSRGWVVSLERWSRFHVPALLGLTVLLQLSALIHPEHAVVGWRQADNASVARNYFQNGFHFLYPQIDWGGDGPGYVEMEFPLLQFLLALLYGVFGFHEGLAVVLPLCAGLGTVWALYALVRRVFDAPTALAAALTVAVSPSFGSYSRTFMVDAPMACLSVLAVLAFDRWMTDARGGDLLSSALCLAVATLIKPYALVAGVPIFWLVYARYGRRVLAVPRLWGFLVAVLLPSLLWYAHAYSLARDYHNTVGVLLGGGYSKLANAETLLSPAFYIRVFFKWLPFHLVTPGFFLFLPIGLATRLPDRRQWLFHIWALAGLAYVLVVAVGNNSAVYYQLPLLPCAAALAALGLVRAVRWLDQLSGTRGTLSTGLATAIAFMLAVGVAAGRLAYARFSDPLPGGLAARNQARAAATLLRPGALIVEVTALDSPGYTRRFSRGHHQTPPEFFYFSGHRGWYLAIPWLTIDEIEALRRRGAEYVVVPAVYDRDPERLRTTAPDVYRYLSTNYSVLANTSGILIVDLGPSKRTSGMARSPAR